MRRPCWYVHESSLAESGIDYRQGVDCFLCWQSLNSEPHRILWDGTESNEPTAPVKRTPTEALECRYSGRLLRTETCQTCLGDVRIKVYGCGCPARQSPESGNGETTIANCQACRLWEAKNV